MKRNHVYMMSITESVRLVKWQMGEVVMFRDAASTEIYTLSLREELPIWPAHVGGMKASDISRDGGDYSFDFYMETKNICAALDTHKVPSMGK